MALIYGFKLILNYCLLFVAALRHQNYVNESIATMMNLNNLREKMLKQQRNFLNCFEINSFLGYHNWFEIRHFGVCRSKHNFSLRFQKYCLNHPIREGASCAGLLQNEHTFYEQSARNKYISLVKVNVKSKMSIQRSLCQYICLHSFEEFSQGVDENFETIFGSHEIHIFAFVSKIPTHSLFYRTI